MLNLLNHLTELDNKRIENYIAKYGAKAGYIGNEKWLSAWAQSKKKLFSLLGGKLIVKVPFSYEKTTEERDQQIRDLLLHKSDYIDLCKKVNDRTKAIRITEDSFTYHDVRAIERIFECDVVGEKTNNTVKIKLENKKLLQIQKGTKVFKAIQKIVDYFGFTDLLETIEKYRIIHSQILNDKKVTGTMCFSIHPLDFMTMSDNANDWRSCMSWVERGCYRVGTLEMMNSNNVVCVYIESNSNFVFGNELTEENTWNSKKWRQLFIVTKDIIVGGKEYPNHIQPAVVFALATLRDLAKQNWKHEYKFGPELYKDMAHVDSLYRMDRNRNWIKMGKTFKHNILFDTKGMYNDLLNDNSRAYWCVRNKVEKTKIVSYSGKSLCLCCGKPVIEESDNYDYYWGGAYNDRFDNCNSLICYSCEEKLHCDFCDNVGEVVVIDGRKYCEECFDKWIRVCPVTGEKFSLHEQHRWYEATYIKLKSSEDDLNLLEKEIGRDIYDDEPERCNRMYLRAVISNKGRDILMEQGIIEQRIVKRKEVSFWENEKEEVYIMDFRGNEEALAAAIKKYSFKNSEKVVFE